MFLRSRRLNQDFVLFEGTRTIGRARDCWIILEPNQVSKHHLRVRVKDDAVEVCDRDSRNNSKVNDIEIRGQGWIQLQPQDVVEICGFDFRLLDESSKDVSGSCVVQSGDSDSYYSGSGSQSIPLSKYNLEESRQFVHLKALLAITNTLRDVLHAEEVLERAVGILFEIFPDVDRAAICYFTEEDIVQPKWWQVREGDPDTTIRVSQNISRHVKDSSEAVITMDALTDFGDAKSVHAVAMRSVMCCPLIDADGEVFGIIHVDSDKPQRFDENDLQVLAAVAMQISLAINCSRLHAIAVSDELLRRDVEQASAVLERYLPDAPPPCSAFELAGFYRAARHVGGDYLDYVNLPDGRLAIVLGDVVGKGVPAALTMVRLATETRAGLEVCQTPRELLARLNKKFADEFITLVVMILDDTTGEVVLSNAGHELPLVRKCDGQVTPTGLEFSGCPIGVLDEEGFEDLNIPLEDGESLIVFSDGFPDAEHKPSGKRFGAEAICQALSGTVGSASEIVARVVKEVDTFIDNSPQFDDMCMACIRKTAQ